MPNGSLLANALLAQKTNHTANANSYSNQAIELLGDWVSTSIGKEILYFYDGKSSNLYSNKQVLSEYEKLVFKLFPAAPERVIKKYTLYKSASVAPAYFAVSRTTLSNKNSTNEKQKSFNQQWQDVVDVLKDNEENVWDCKSIDQIIEMSETRVGSCMSALCNLLNQQMTTGTVLITDLWEKIQKELGYYDTSVCCYLLGFAFKYFEGKYTWHDGNNSHKLDENTIPTMIFSMVTGKATGMKISSESDVEKRFKSICKRLFVLKDDEAVDVYECRKNIKIHITKTGYPLWAAKYSGDVKTSNETVNINALIDKFDDYILENGNQPDLMEEIINIFKGNPKYYNSFLPKILNEKSKLHEGLNNFILDNSPQTKETCEQYGINESVMITTLHRSLEEEIWQWSEEKTLNIMRKVYLDLKLIGVVNKALGGAAESVEKIRETLERYLNYIRVPGSVYSSLPDKWAIAVSELYEISINKWVSFTLEEKEQILSDLSKYGKTAIECINSPRTILRAYVHQRDLGEFSDAEYDEILNSLPKEPFTQSESSFRSNIVKKIQELDYTRKKNILYELWKSISNCETLAEWTNKYRVPAVWVIPDQDRTFSVLRSLEHNERLEIAKLENAITELKDGDFKALTEENAINKQFILNISSDKYVDILLPKVDKLRNVISKRFNDPNSWPNHIVMIREIIEADILETIRTEAKSIAEKMSDLELRNKLNALLDISSDACLIFIEK